MAGIALLVGLVGIGQLAGGDGDGPAGQAPADRASDPPGGNVAGRSVPAQSFERFDGTAGTLADYRGRPVVVNFWSSWCPPCVAEMPDFEAVHQRLGDRVAFVGVNLTDEPAAAQALARRTGVSYDLARDADGRLFQAMGGFSMPTTFFVSADGQIVDQHSGPLSRSRLERLITEDGEEEEEEDGAATEFSGVSAARRTLLSSSPGRRETVGAQANAGPPPGR